MTGSHLHVAPPARPTVDRRVALLAVACVALGLVMGGVAQGLDALIALITNSPSSDASRPRRCPRRTTRSAPWVIVVPVLGALIVGVMARYGSQAIRGHGIPEAMEQVLLNESRIPRADDVPQAAVGGDRDRHRRPVRRGGPDHRHRRRARLAARASCSTSTADERKTLLAAGAAAGMAATFGTPGVARCCSPSSCCCSSSARARSSPWRWPRATATGVRIALRRAARRRSRCRTLAQPGGAALACYVVLGALIGRGLASCVTRAVYAIEDALRAAAASTGCGGRRSAARGRRGRATSRRARSASGYDNIEDIARRRRSRARRCSCSCVLKFVSWSIALGSGTSGGTLAPLFTIGGGLGALLGRGWSRAVRRRSASTSRIAALVGMAAIFAGASRALLASVVFAFETTRQPLGPAAAARRLRGGVPRLALLMRHSIMTEKIARRGAQRADRVRGGPPRPASSCATSWPAAGG